MPTGYISPWAGLQHAELTGQLHPVLRRLGSAILKPHQKLNLLITYITPSSFMPLPSLTLPPITTIRNMDPLIRIHVNDILHLPDSIPNALIYCCKRHGDLGIPKL